jgi:O-antigen ligase
LALLLVLLAAVWVAGGASRADVIGQAIVRGTSAALLVIAALFARRPHADGAGPVIVILSAALLLVLVQLVPLPPGIWEALPGRAMFVPAAIGEQPWRPLSIVPSATLNSAASLIVPLAAVLLVLGLSRPERYWLPVLVLGVVIASMLLGLWQLSGQSIDHPFINDTGQISGPFANRNHLALLLAFGCVLAPVWAFDEDARSIWRGPVALGLVIVFLLVILGGGSRAGVLLGVSGFLVGLLIARKGLRRELKRAPRWTLPALVAGISAIVAAFFFISFFAGRAESISRAMRLDTMEDIRTRALPTVLAMIQTYLPAGSGFGSFDPAFRIHEPFALLKPTYFNHAHCDFLEVALEGGLPALLLLLAAIGWWVLASFRVWRASGSADMTMGRVGSTMLALTFVASAVDYPARTPLIMVVIAIAAIWLGWSSKAAVEAALPRGSEHL